MVPSQVVAALVADRDALAARWMHGRRRRSAVAVELMGAVVQGLAGSGVRDELTGTATALGVLAAQQGRSSTALVEDVLALRPILWGAVGALPDAAGDLGLLLEIQDRLSESIDVALRRAVDAYVQESTRVLSHRATRDPLTGLVNRAAFDEALTTELAAASRGRVPALLLLDLDGFKKVNDTLGHQKGDEVLVLVARALETTLRGHDVPARLGGDEFAVLLAATKPNDAARVARRVVRAITRDRELRAMEPTVRTSVGVGWAPPGATAKQLVAMTDAALYRAKRAGGDRAELCRPADMIEAGLDPAAETTTPEPIAAGVPR